MGPEWTAFLFTLAAAGAVLGAMWLQLRETRRALAQRELTAERWNEHLDDWWRRLRDREALLRAAERRYG